MFMGASRSRRGFTLIEMLLVIGIIGVLLGLLLAGVMRVREAANIAQSKNNLRQIILGIHHFASNHQDRLPVVGDALQVKIASNLFAPGKKATALFVRILPYLEVQISEQISNSQLNAGLFNPKFLPVPLLLSPSDPSVPAAMVKYAGVTSYAANGQV